jgi:hypothetical protein
MYNILTGGDFMSRPIKSYINEIQGTPEEEEKEKIRNKKVVTRRAFIWSVVGGLGGGLLAGGVGSYFLFDGRDKKKKITRAAYKMPGREEKLPVKGVRPIIGRKADCNNFDPAYCHLIIKTEHDMDMDGNLDAVELHLYSERLNISKGDFFRMADNLEGAEMVGLTSQPVISNLPMKHPDRRKGLYPKPYKTENGYVIKTLFNGVTKYEFYRQTP